jgi:hypothetical protein
MRFEAAGTTWLGFFENMLSRTQRIEASIPAHVFAAAGALACRRYLRARVMLRYSLNADGGDRRVLIF